MLKPRLVHISADYPDPIVPAKTAAIRNLVHLIDTHFANRVISLNRRSVGAARLASLCVRGFGTPALHIEDQPFPDGIAMAYRAPGKGLWHHALLAALGDVIARRVEESGGADLVVGHKLTVEGIAAARASQRLAIPFALTIQGDTDTKILAARPDLRARFARIFHEAALVCSFAPWSLAAVEALLGKRQGPVCILPCPTELDTVLPPRIVPDSLLSVFHLASHRRKNLAGMARALDRARGQRPELALAVVGGGSASDQMSARAATGAVQGLAFEGPLPRDAMAARMNRATGLLLPSRRETFGMVFVEALFAGCPVIYPRGRAIDGYFEGAPFAIAVDPHDPAEIAAAMLHLAREEAEIKNALAQWQISAGASRFTRAAIGASYAGALSGVLDAPALHASQGAS
ncbi:glycosyltransferase [Alteraurantiacibacter palmitatis]|uniref:Glycosyltransferase n=1 Tax=Alteraurantiacibacter palmitatis TaxID=2054628 RepID=A0ABV7E648_9SPHN